MRDKLIKILKLYYSSYNISKLKLDFDEEDIFDSNQIICTLRLNPKNKMNNVHSYRYRKFIDIVDKKMLIAKMHEIIKWIREYNKKTVIPEEFNSLLLLLKDDEFEEIPIVIQGEIQIRKYRENGKIKTELPNFLFNNITYSKSFLKTIFELPPRSIPKTREEIKTIYGVSISVTELTKLRKRYYELFPLIKKYWTLDTLKDFDKEDEWFCD